MKDYLTPQELATLWNLRTRQVYELLKEMRTAGRWLDYMVRPKRTTLTTADAFEDFLKWRDMQKWKEQHEQRQ